MTNLQGTPCSHSPPVPDSCHLCWLATHVRSFQKKWRLPLTGSLEKAPPDRLARITGAPPLARPAPRPQPPDPRQPCSRLGLPTGETLPCQTCTGVVSVPLLTCSLHGTCTATKLVKHEDGTPVKCCNACTDRLSTIFIPQRRHLAYHLLPAEGDVWKRNVDELAARWDLFDGTKIISVVTGEHVQGQAGASLLKLDSPEVVRQYLPADAEVVTVENDPWLWESASWSALFGRVAEVAGPNDAVFYAHAKGASRPHQTIPFRWAQLMYASLLDHWGVVSDRLQKFPIVGSFRKVGRHFRESPEITHSSWHFSGNFWVARARELVRRLATVPPPRHPWASEAWCGLSYGPHEGGVIFNPPGKSWNLYQDRDLSAAERAYSEWSAKELSTSGGKQR